jgi:hypothetical protein
MSSLDSEPPADTPYEAFTAHTSKYTRVRPDEPKEAARSRIEEEGMGMWGSSGMGWTVAEQAEDDEIGGGGSASKAGKIGTVGQTRRG